MKILLLGSSGMLGKSIYHHLKNDFVLYTNGLRKRKYDLYKKKNLLYLLNRIKPDVIINSSGATNIEICEKEKNLAKRTRALGTGEDLSGVSPEYAERYTDDLLMDWNPGKGRKPNASGGLAKILEV